MRVEKLDLSALDAVLDLLRSYYVEAGVRRVQTLCEERFAATIRLALSHEDYGVFGAYDEDRLVGVVIGLVTWSFFKENEADIDLFYVDPAYRGTWVGRHLVDAVIKFCESRNCALIYTACAGMFDDSGKNDRLYVNLFRRFGFEETGTMVHKIIGDRNNGII